MSGLYGKAKESFLSQNPSIDMDTDTIKASIGRQSAYTVDLANHQFKSSATTVQDANAALSGRSVTAGVFDAIDSVFTAVPSGAALDFIIVWKDTGTASTSPLVVYFDGFSVTPNGGDITAQWDNGTNRIFKL
jgi:hypothetical protein